MIAEEFPLGLQGLLDSALDDGLAHLDGQGLDGIEVDVEPGPLLAVRRPAEFNLPANQAFLA